MLGDTSSYQRICFGFVLFIIIGSNLEGCFWRPIIICVGLLLWLFTRLSSVPHVVWHLEEIISILTTLTLYFIV